MVLRTINQERHTLLALVHNVIFSREKFARGIPPRKIFQSTLSIICHVYYIDRYMNLHEFTDSLTYQLAVYISVRVGKIIYVCEVQ